MSFASSLYNKVSPACFPLTDWPLMWLHKRRQRAKCFPLSHSFSSCEWEWHFTVLWRILSDGTCGTDLSAAKPGPCMKLAATVMGRAARAWHFINIKESTITTPVLLLCYFTYFKITSNLQKSHKNDIENFHMLTSHITMVLLPN